MGNGILEHQGRLLLKMARESIREKLGIPSEGPAKKQEVPEKYEDKAFLDTKQGLFVTLHKHGALRGCIGTIEPVKVLRQGICDNARLAAFHDTRFSPLTLDEFHEVDIEISLLSVPEPLEFTTSEELLAGILPQIHGVIIKKGNAGATFLPQVWEQLPMPEDFLNQLCIKAGLSSTAWKNEGLAVQTYEVQCFSENP